MTTPLESTTAIASVQPGTSEVVAGPWPNYSNCRHLPERDRWEVYAMAKASRGVLEDRGVVMTESYDAFIARVTRELDI
ncbi:hypothetical protein [Pseudomonas sp. IPO3774]|uniref:hypothetical protein n=1 Tax=Pseudomonas sp. IPO3774 TaxID=2738826 RepID=UPI0015A227E0|nr:hypothetical protein [Pseudomonas sp. IPO3774]NWD63581.1 hypothetical protein [Pseudomonas sp. IPO3774]